MYKPKDMNKWIKKLWYPISQSTRLTPSGVLITTYIGNSKVRIHDIDYQPTRKELEVLKKENLEYAKQRRDLL